MNYHQQQRNLQSVGMACFVNYFDEFTNPSRPNWAVAEILRQRESYTPSSCSGRVSTARSIIKAGRAHDALLLIAAASKMDYRTAQQAKTLADNLSSR